ncbi:hypothetical protein D3C78_436360 [compost metagenome]
MPGVLGQQARGHSQLAGTALQLARQRRCQGLAAHRRLMLRIALGQLRLQRHPEQAREIVGFGQQIATPLPVGLSCAGLARHMAAKFEPGGIRLCLGQLALHQLLIVTVQAAQQHRAAPAIQHAVMGAEDNLVMIGGQFEAGDPQQRRLVQRNGMGQILLTIGRDMGLGLRIPHQILIVERQLGALQDALQRNPFRQHQFAAKGRPAGDLPLPGLTVDRQVQWLAILNLGLQVVSRVTRRQRPVMEHALLQGRHGQQGLHLAPAQHPIQRPLREAKPREVARGVARNLQVAAVIHQRRQVVRQPCHQGVAPLLVEGTHLAQGETAIKHATVQADQLARQVVRGRGGPRCHRQRLPGLSSLALMADPQIVEDHQGFGQCPATGVV